MDLPKVIELRKQTELVYQKITEDVVKIIDFMLYFDKNLSLKYVTFPTEVNIGRKTETIYTIDLVSALDLSTTLRCDLTVGNYMVFDKTNKNCVFLDYTKSEFIEEFGVKPKDEGIIYIPSDEITGTAILFNKGEELEFIRNFFDYVKNNPNKNTSLSMRQNLDEKIWYLNVFMKGFMVDFNTQLIPGTYVVIKSNNYSRMEYNVELKELGKYYEKER